MVDGVPKYDQMLYTTSEGEHCCAQKSGNTVTIQGDLHGIRQVPYTEFLPQFIKDQAAKGSLERTPAEDTVFFRGGTDNKVSETMTYHDINVLEGMTEYSRPTGRGNYTMDFEGSGVQNGHPEDSFHLNVENKLSGRKVSGQLYTKEANLEVKSKPLNMLSGRITGTWDGQTVDIEYSETGDRKGLKIEGTLPNADLVPVLGLLVMDKVQQAEAARTVKW